MMFVATMCVILRFLRIIIRTLFNLKTKIKKSKPLRTTTNSKILRFDLTKNLILLTSSETTCTVRDFRIDQTRDRPLVVLGCWMNCQTKHKYKFGEFWIEKGFDVLAVSLNTWQVLWPVVGSQVVAASILKFLNKNRSYDHILIHGFSASGYLWGEVLVHMSQNMDRYQSILDKIVGQIWDSVGDVEDISSGLPIALFPKNKLMAEAVHQYLVFHLKFFHKITTRHYDKSSKLFHSNIVKAPTLLILSKIDTCVKVSSLQRYKDDYESQGIKVHWKLFEDSPHVEHFRKYPEEYIDQVNIFLDTLNFNKSDPNMERSKNYLK